MKRKAFTLTEMLAAVVLVVIVASALYMLLKTPADFNSYAQREFDVQADIRKTSSIVDSNVKNASAAFLLTKHDKNFKKGWSYFMNEEQDGNAILVLYKWDGTTHQRMVLSEFPKENVTLMMNFQRPSDGGMIKYNIVARDKARDRDFNVQSEVRVMNASNIIDESKVDYSLRPPQKNANCLAFRGDRPDPSVSSNGYHHILVSFVLDVSGSMDNPVDFWGDGPSRINILKSTLNTFIDDIAAQDKAGIVDVRIYPFATMMGEGNRSFLYPEDSEIDNMLDFNATEMQYKKFFNVKKRGTPFLKSMVNSLTTSGMTNPGDGIRYAYHGMLDYERLIKKHHKGVDKRIKHYVFVLTDGQPNVTTVGYKEEVFVDFENWEVQKDSSGQPIILKGLSDDEVFPKSLGYVGAYKGSGRALYYVKGKPAAKKEMYYNQSIYDYYVYPRSDSTNTYLGLVSSLIKDHRTPMLGEKVDVTVVGFSSNSYDNRMCDFIGKSLGAKPVADSSGKMVHYKDCASNDALKAVFKTFTETILTDALWYISGPE